MFLELFAGLSNFPVPTAASNGAAATGQANPQEDARRWKSFRALTVFGGRLPPSGFQAGRFWRFEKPAKLPRIRRRRSDFCVGRIIFRAKTVSLPFPRLQIRRISAETGGDRRRRILRILRFGKGETATVQNYNLKCAAWRGRDTPTSASLSKPAEKKNHTKFDDCNCKKAVKNRSLIGDMALKAALPTAKGRQFRKELKPFRQATLLEIRNGSFAAFSTVRRSTCIQAARGRFLSMPFGGESGDWFPALTSPRPNGRQPYALRFSLKSEAFFISDRLFSKNFITAGMAFKAEPAYGAASPPAVASMRPARPPVLPDRPVRSIDRL